MMAFLLQHHESVHVDILSSTIQKWSNSQPDIFIISKEGHKIYTQSLILRFYSRWLSDVIDGCKDDVGISVEASSNAIGNLLKILSSGMAVTSTKSELQEAAEIAESLGINFQNWRIGEKRKKSNKSTLTKVERKFLKVTKLSVREPKPVEFVHNNSSEVANNEALEHDSDDGSVSIQESKDTEVEYLQEDSANSGKVANNEIDKDHELEVDMKIMNDNTGNQLNADCSSMDDDKGTKLSEEYNSMDDNTGDQLNEEYTSVDDNTGNQLNKEYTSMDDNTGNQLNEEYTSVDDNTGNQLNEEYTSMDDNTGNQISEEYTSVDDNTGNQSNEKYASMDDDTENQLNYTGIQLSKEYTSVDANTGNQLIEEYNPIEDNIGNQLNEECTSAGNQLNEEYTSSELKLLNTNENDNHQRDLFDNVELINTEGDPENELSQKNITHKNQTSLPITEYSKCPEEADTMKENNSYESPADNIAPNNQKSLPTLEHPQYQEVIDENYKKVGEDEPPYVDNSLEEEINEMDKTSIERVLEESFEIEDDVLEEDFILEDEMILASEEEQDYGEDSKYVSESEEFTPLNDNYTEVTDNEHMNTETFEFVKNSHVIEASEQQDSERGYCKDGLDEDASRKLGLLREDYVLEDDCHVIENHNQLCETTVNEKEVDKCETEKNDMLTEQQVFEEEADAHKKKDESVEEDTINGTNLETQEIFTGISDLEYQIYQEEKVFFKENTSDTTPHIEDNSAKFTSYDGPENEPKIGNLEEEFLKEVHIESPAKISEENNFHMKTGDENLEKEVSNEVEIDVSDIVVVDQKDGIPKESCIQEDINVEKEGDVDISHLDVNPIVELEEEQESMDTIDDFEDEEDDCTILEIIDNKVDSSPKAQPTFKGKVEKIEHDELQEDFDLEDEMDFSFAEDTDFMDEDELDEILAFSEQNESEDRSEVDELQEDSIPQDVSDVDDLKENRTSAHSLCSTSSDQKSKPDLDFDENRVHLNEEIERNFDFENSEMEKESGEIKAEMDLTNIESQLSGMYGGESVDGKNILFTDDDFTATENGEFVCNTCGKNFSKKSKMKKHWIDVHSGIRFPCDQCSYMGKRRDNLNSHIRKKHI